MSHYRIIDSAIDNDSKFNSLPNPAQHLWFRIFNNQFNTAIGAFRAERQGLAARYKYAMREFNKHFNLLISKNFLRYDDRAGLLWFPNFMRYNKPNSINCIKAWEKIPDLLPECDLKAEIIQKTAIFVYENLSQSFIAALPFAFRDALTLAIPDAYAMPSRMQKQRTETENKSIIINREINNSVSEKIEIVANEENKKIFELPAKKGDNFPLFESDISIFKNNYPAVDVINELQKMKEWLTEKQFPKSYFAMREFIKTWLGRAQLESDNIHSIEKQGAKKYGKTSAVNPKIPSAFEQAMSPSVQWAAE